MAEKKIAIVEPETKEDAGQCCEPECGPTICPSGPEETAVTEVGISAPSGCRTLTCS